ncbi:hypothetical protein VTN49DRAFT_6056 [Thermomyces lanuginosus]|uniref:uncharacterized protein n=1 Tax=Thermomyces lanuginosus TaxID=5541 RepID=UPI0037441403
MRKYSREPAYSEWPYHVDSPDFSVLSLFPDSSILIVNLHLLHAAAFPIFRVEFLECFSSLECSLSAFLLLGILVSRRVPGSPRFKVCVINGPAFSPTSNRTFLSDTFPPDHRSATMLTVSRPNGSSSARGG